MRGDASPHHMSRVYRAHWTKTKVDTEGKETPIAFRYELCITGNMSFVFLFFSCSSFIFQAASLLLLLCE